MSQSTIDLAARAAALLGDLSCERLRGLVDPTTDTWFTGLVEHTSSTAGGVWLVESDGRSLVLAYNVGGQGAALEGQIHQTLETGLVSKAFKEGATICPKGIFRPREQSADVDRKLAQVTAHEIATPFSLFGQRCGVLAVVQTLSSGRTQKTRWGYTDADIKAVENASSVLGRLLEYAWLRPGAGG